MLMFNVNILNRICVIIIREHGVPKCEMMIAFLCCDNYSNKILKRPNEPNVPLGSLMLLNATYHELNM